MKTGLKKGLIIAIAIVLILVLGIAGVFLYMTGKMHFHGDDGEIDQVILESETEIRESAAERYERDLLHLENVTDEEADDTYTLLVIGTKHPAAGSDEEELPVFTFAEETDEEGISEMASEADGGITPVVRKARDQAQAIILMTINHSMEEVYFNTFHTDLYAVLPDIGGYRLGTIYRAGGGPLLIRTLEENYGIRIDNYATISLEDVAEEMGMDEFADLNVSEEGVDVIERLVYGMGEMDSGQVVGYITKLLSYVHHDITQAQMLRMVMQIPKIVAYTSEKSKLPYDGLYTEEEGYLVPDIIPTASKLGQIYRKAENPETDFIS